MRRAFICDYIRTPIGRYAGALSAVRTDDLAAAPIRAVLNRHTGLDWAQIDEVILGCANQAGEDNRNVARMAGLLAGLPETVPAITLNRLCASGMDAVIAASRAIVRDGADLVIAGGVESMTRAPFVTAKADTAFARTPEMYDSTIGWRFVNARMAKAYGTESMPETAENVAAEHGISRVDQDKFAYRSQMRAGLAQASGRLAQEICPIIVSQSKSAPVQVSTDEHPRQTSLDALARLPTPFGGGETVTAGNAAGINDGAAALLIASEAAVKRHGLTPMAEIIGAASAGTAPRLMGIGPVPATQKLCSLLGLTAANFDLIEMNEAFAAQAIAVLRALGIAEDAPFVNPNGGAIALGHPLGMTGARLAGTAAFEVAAGRASLALCSMCVGVGQGVSLALRQV